MSARLGLKGIPAEAEEIMAIRDILLARRTGGHIHLCHMSTRGSVELIRWGKERGINVTAEVCPHHLSLTEDAVEGYDTNAKMNPPLRTAADVEALQEAVRDGTIDVIATDHAPHHYDEKEREFADAPNGIVGLETALAVNRDVARAVGDHRLADARRADVVRAGAAVQAARAARCGKGALADVTVFDPDARVDRRSGAIRVEGTQHAVRRPDAARARRCSPSSTAASIHRRRGSAAVSARGGSPRRSSPSAGGCTIAG